MLLPGCAAFDLLQLDILERLGPQRGTDHVWSGGSHDSAAVRTMVAKEATEATEAKEAKAEKAATAEKKLSWAETINQRSELEREREEQLASLTAAAEAAGQLEPPTEGI